MSKYTDTLKRFWRREFEASVSFEISISDRSNCRFKDSIWDEANCFRSETVLIPLSDGDVEFKIPVGWNRIDAEPLRLFFLFNDAGDDCRFVALNLKSNFSGDSHADLRGVDGESKISGNEFIGSSLTFLLVRLLIFSFRFNAALWVSVSMRMQIVSWR